MEVTPFPFEKNISSARSPELNTLLKKRGYENAQLIRRDSTPQLEAFN